MRNEGVQEERDEQKKMKEARDKLAEEERIAATVKIRNLMREC